MKRMECEAYGMRPISELITKRGLIIQVYWCTHICQNSFYCFFVVYGNRGNRNGQFQLHKLRSVGNTAVKNWMYEQVTRLRALTKSIITCNKKSYLCCVFSINFCFYLKLLFFPRCVCFWVSEWKQILWKKIITNSFITTT